LPIPAKSPTTNSYLALVKEKYHTEPALIADLQQGSEEAFTYIYNAYKKQVFLYAKRFVEAVSDAEDLTADAFIKMWQRKQQFDTTDAVSAFLHVTIRNSCYNFLRHAGVKRDNEKELLQILQSQQQADHFGVENVRIELINIIYQEVEKLPARMKEVFLLSYREGLRPAQIAERLQLSVQTVKNQRVTAVRVLKEALRNYPAAIAVLLMMEIESNTRLLIQY
jgi:RNA polymerase sigma-70 factor (family 1)